MNYWRCRVIETLKVLTDLFTVLCSMYFALKSIRVSDKQDQIHYLLWSMFLLMVLEV